VSRTGPESAEIEDFREPENAQRFRGVSLETGGFAAGDERNERTRVRQTCGLEVVA
ncbi:MAG: hypothetical protein IH933_11475, partial [Euryarchaeota archaeon]|nr:hypothetical protein [Euryarchaeota archaeon]